MTPTTPTKSPVDTIREAGNDLITFLHEASDMAIIGPNPSDDWHRRKRQVIENWDAALSSLSAQPAQTMMSTDYEALYELLCKGGEALGWVWPKGKDAYRESAWMRMSDKRWMQIHYVDEQGLSDAWESDEGKDVFITECTRLKLEWVAPLPSQTEEVAKLRAFKEYVHKRLDEAGIEKNPPGEHAEAGCRIGQRLDLVLCPQTEGLEEPDHICDLLMELHGEFYGKGKAHADAFRAIPKVVDFIKSRSLPRQKGEVVAWMKRDTTSDLLPESALDLAMEPDAAAHIRKTWMPLCEALPK